jgi:phosphatidylglycerol---prolipoprotein diacylglyceryl transferase
LRIDLRPAARLCRRARLQFLSAPVPFESFGLDPVLTPDWFPFPIRWYALAYIGGLIVAWAIARRLVRNDEDWAGRARPKPDDFDDLIVWCAVGVILGGRLAHVIFYDFAVYAADPMQILRIWKGGMSFHGGLIGALIAMALFARRRKLPVLSFFDVAALVAPIGLFLGRVANFINGELYGRATDGSWGIVFPQGGPIPRHPSQLYEAATEGLLLLALVWIVFAVTRFRRPGLLAGVFGVGYALARIGSEFAREPDRQLGFLLGDWGTMGMILSVPVLVAGLWLILAARRAAPA